MGALDNYSLVFVVFINFFGQLKDWVGQVLYLVSCSKGQVKKYVNVEACCTYQTPPCETSERINFNVIDKITINLFFIKKMSQNVWVTIMPFGPVTLIFYWPKIFFQALYIYIHMYKYICKAIWWVPLAGTKQFIILEYL